MTSRDDTVMDPLVERELAALDAALAGEPVDPDLTGLASLARAVREERPVPDADFARGLDERAAAGFPRPPRRLPSITSLRPRFSRRILLPAMGAAASLLAVVLVASSLLDDDTRVRDGSSPGSPALTQERSGGGSGEAVSPSVVPPIPGPGPGDDDLAPGRARRVERQATLVLETASDEIASVADRVVRVTDEVGGIVVTSSVSSADDDRGGATFALRVPTRRLDDALARLSKLAHVRSRTQNSQDVTGAFVTAEERLDDALAERQGLLRALARADSANETASIRARLRIVRSEIASARAEVRRLRVRTDHSTVNVTIEPGSSSGGSGVDGVWTPGDAADDAVRVLEVAAGVLLVALAVVAPFAVLGALGVFAGRVVRRRRREQALETG
jgi:Domain of unknown function (DUF4349)